MLVKLDHFQKKMGVKVNNIWAHSLDKMWIDSGLEGTSPWLRCRWVIRLSSQFVWSTSLFRICKLCFWANFANTNATTNLHCVGMNMRVGQVISFNILLPWIIPLSGTYLPHTPHNSQLLLSWHFLQTQSQIAQWKFTLNNTSTHFHLLS